MKDYCEKCDSTVEVRDVRTDVGYEWRCVVCGTVTDEEWDDSDWVDDPEEE